MNQSDAKFGVNLIGYFKTAVGLGETIRLLAETLKRKNIPYSIVSADFLATDHYQEEVRVKFDNQFIYPVNIFCIDPLHIIPLLAYYGWNQFKDRHNIGLCFWETNVVPKKHLQMWKHFDEIWTSSRYVQEHLSLSIPLPVYRISHPLEFTYTSDKTQENLKLSFGLCNKFTFYFSFAFSSILERKNPLAIIKAFKKAFPDKQDVQLVIKSQRGIDYPNELNAILNPVKEDKRIIWIDTNLSSIRRYDLMNACDCYVSLHRSEGFGLTMAEAMFLNKPVIATGYSGNLDFMNEDNSYLCSYKLIPIDKKAGPYLGMWADVDIDDTSRWMKHIVANPEEAKIRAEKGNAFVLKYHSMDCVGVQIVRRLEKIVPRAVSKPQSFLVRKEEFRKNIIGRYPRFAKTVRFIKKCVFK